MLASFFDFFLIFYLQFQSCDCRFITTNSSQKSSLLCLLLLVVYTLILLFAFVMHLSFYHNNDLFLVFGHSIFFFYYYFELLCPSLSQVSCSSNSTITPSSGSNSLLSPVGSISRPISLTNSSLCSESTTSSVSSLTSNYPKAPGFEREDQVHRPHSSDLGRI